MIMNQRKRWVFMMSIKHFFILVLSSFNILFACFYDDPNMIVHLKDTIVDCYSIKIVYNYPMEKCGGLLTGLGLEQKKGCIPFQENESNSKLYDSIKEYVSNSKKKSLFYLNNNVHLTRIITQRYIENKFFVYDTTIKDSVFRFFFSTLYDVNGNYKKRWITIDTLLRKKDIEENKLWEYNSYNSEIALSCLDLMDLNIQSGKYNVPEKFFIAYKKYKTPKMLGILNFKAKGLYLDLFIQFKSERKIQMFHTSYIEPGDVDYPKISKIILIDSMVNQLDSIQVKDLWGADSLFTPQKISKEKWSEMRILIPIFDIENNENNHIGYACTNWVKLKNVTLPQKCNTSKNNQPADSKFPIQVTKPAIKGLLE